MRDETFIGRSRELGAIDGVLTRICAGSAAFVLLSGEPGIGKSRLLTEVAQRGRARGIRVLTGYALDGAALPALLPLRTVLGDAIGALPVATAEHERRLAVLGAAGIVAARAEPPVALSAEAERLRLFEALAASLAGLAAMSPLLLLLDDMQWADAQSWELLLFAARRLSSEPIGVLLAVREEALHHAHTDAARAMVELSRLRLLEHLPLRGLAANEVLRLAAGSLAAPPAEELAQRLFERSGGNPFFLEELVRELAGRSGEDQPLSSAPAGDAEQSLPLTLRLAVQQRLERLPAQTGQALTMAALIGRFVDVWLLADSLGVDSDALDATLEPAIADGVLRRERDHVAFTHDVIRETLIDQASGQRRRNHAAIAAALEVRLGAVQDASALATLAHHWALAAQPLRSGQAALAASDAAWSARQPRESAQYARLAVETLRSVAASAPESRARARFALGRAALANGDYVESEQALRSALLDCATVDERALAARIWLELGRLLRRREQHEPAAQALQQALAAVDDNHEQSALLVETLIELAGVEGMSRGHFEEAAVLGQRALDYAGERSLAALESRAALTLADIRGRAGQPIEARPLLERAAERALAAGDNATAIEACSSLANVCYWSGDLRASRRYAELRLRLAVESGDPFALRHAHSWLALLAWTRGELDEAQHLLQAADQRLRHLETPEPVAFARLVTGMVAFRRGDLAQACALAGEASALFASIDDTTPIWYAGWEALALAAANRAAEARTVVLAQQRRIATFPADALAARSARTTLALVYAVLGDRDGAAQCEAALRAFPDDFHWTSTRRSLAALAALRGDRATAFAQLAVAEKLAREQAAAPELALTLLARAALLPAADPTAERCRHEAAEIAARCGVQFPEYPRRDARPHEIAGLSPRELEVLRLVAQGKTNREIAGELVVSERTVINHLSHIFTKIDVPNRATATAYALRHDIA